jgi:hypothetical protein
MNSSSAHDVEKKLKELNIGIGEAEKEHNLDFLKTILSDDLVFRRANGKIVNKKEYLESVQNPENTFDYLYSEDVKPIVYESAAMVLLRVRAKGKRGPDPFEGNYRNIRLFLKNQDWQCVMWFNIEVQEK